jgi:phosphoglucosamine mutase
MLACALMAGLCASGAEILDLGVITTPGVALLLQAYKADAGVMITASHNPFEHNGIKFFDKDGFKLPDSLEDEIEELIRAGVDLLPAAKGRQIGRIRPCESAAGDYIAILKRQTGADLSGLKVVLDCANGSASRIAPRLFAELGAELIAIHAEPDGVNINDRCGSTHLESLKKAVLDHHADAGLAFDGDADRLLAVDEAGEALLGDHILLICGQWLKAQGKLKGNTVVSTVMSNIGLDVAMKGRGIELLRANVGDRYVLEKMREGGYSLGGENSGHVIFLDHSPTGDGILTGIQLLRALKQAKEEDKKTLSALAGELTIFPQVLLGVQVENSQKEACLQDKAVKEAIQRAKDALGQRGRVLVRPSGTEALVRVMVEGPELAQVEALAEGLARLIEERAC